MSYAGEPWGYDPGDDPQLQQQLQTDRRRQMLAYSLMANQNPSNAPYSGVANATNSIAGALMMRGAQDNQQNALYQARLGNMQQSASAMGLDLTPPTINYQPSFIDRLFTLGGSGS
jgi:hypothetical protein